MKKMLILTIILHAAIVSVAQNADSLFQRRNKAIKQPVSQTMKPKNIIKNQPLQELLPDLVITRASISKTSTGYIVNYTITNTGTAPVKVNINGIRLFGRVKDNGLEMSSSYSKLLQDGALLNPGGIIDNQFTISSSVLNTLANGIQYKYYLTVDHINDIPELNETNNTFEINFRYGY
ncbi:MAG: hypothetical protein IPK57_00585 [Chitinophagaceae bacterium]|nr:hypothetical protein [Chitinophagaceae bacterium]